MTPLARRALLALPLVPAPRAAGASDWPSRTVRILSGFGPGGGQEGVNRRITQSFSEAFGQPFVIDSRPGAGGNIAMDMLAKSPPDGYTLCTSQAGPVVINPIILGAAMPYNPVTDILPITRTSEFPFVLVAHMGVPSDLDAFLAWLRRHPDEFFSSPGVGSTGHLIGAQVSRGLGLGLQHVAYRTFSMPDLIEGRVRLAFQTLQRMLPEVAQGKARAILVTGPARNPLLPEVPTFAEAGLPGVAARGWNGLFGPAGLPEAIAGRIRAQAAALLHAPEVASWMRSAGLEPVTDSTTESFARFLTQEREHWRRVIAETGPGLL